MRKAIALAAAGLAALGVHRYAGLRRKMSAVAPELRTPLLATTSIPFNRLTLPIVRFAMSRESDAGPGITLTEHRLEDADVDVLVLTPSEHLAPGPGVLWLHGGGLVAGTARFEAPWAGRLVAALGSVVVSPDYRLAPENPFPAGLDDCMSTLQWMVKHADELGIDIERIAVCGASAGGGLAAAVAQRAFDEGIRLRVQGLVYPMIDDRTALRDDLERQGRGDVVGIIQQVGVDRLSRSRAAMPRTHLTMRPLPRRTDLTGLPPAWIGVGELDVFHDENVAYAERLRAAGVPCELVTVPGMYHGADGIVQKALSMRDFHASMVEFLRAHLEAAE